MFIRLSASLLLAASATFAMAEEVRVRNVGDRPIYRLYAWASDLTPRYRSLIVVPLKTNEVETVTLDNDWSRCLFTFQIDRNNPREKFNKTKNKRKQTFIEMNICKRDARPMALP